MGRGGAASVWRTRPVQYVGEVDIMIAEASERGKGLGRAAVAAFLHYIHCNMATMLQNCGARDQETSGAGDIQLKHFMVKVKERNAASRALFQGLGFRQHGEVNYFGEVTNGPGLVMGTAIQSARGVQRAGLYEAGLKQFSPFSFFFLFFLVSSQAESLLVFRQYVKADVRAATHDEHHIPRRPFGLVQPVSEMSTQISIVRRRDGGAARRLDQDADVLEEAHARHDGVGVADHGTHEALLAAPQRPV